MHDDQKYEGGAGGGSIQQAAVKCPKCGVVPVVNGNMLKCPRCGMEASVSTVVATHTWGCPKGHGLHSWHFFEELLASPGFTDRAFGVPICARIKKAAIQTATEIEIGGPTFRQVNVNRDDMLPVFRVHDKPRAARCRACQEICDTFEMPRSTRGDVGCE